MKVAFSWLFMENDWACYVIVCSLIPVLRNYCHIGSFRDKKTGDLKITTVYVVMHKIHTDGNDSDISVRKTVQTETLDFQSFSFIDKCK